MKISDLKGLAVLTMVDPQKVGTVDNLILDPGNRRIAAVRVKSARYKTLEYVRAADVKSIGKDAMTIESTGVLGSLSEFSDLANLPDLGALSKVKVVSESGVKLGTVADVEIDTHTQKITRYLLQASFLDTLKHTQRSIEATPEIRYGKGFLMVPDQLGPPTGEEGRASGSSSVPFESPPHERTESSPDEPHYP